MKLPIRSEMDCRHVGALLSQYADSDLPVPRRAQVQAHLDGCAICTARLHTLHSAIAFLEADAQKTPTAMPDLYAGFRERLVTQPSGSSPLARRAQRAGGVWHTARMGLAGISLVAVGYVSIVWHHRVAVLNEAMQGMQMPDNRPTFMRTVVQGGETFFSQGNRQSDILWKDGWRWSSATYSNSKQLFRQQYLTSPGGVTLTWKTPLNDPKILPAINLLWSPTDPQHPRNVDLFYTYLTFRSWLRQIERSKKILFADMETAEETIGGERMNKLTIRHLNTTLGTRPMRHGEYTEPHTLVLWFDAHKRLRQLREEFYSHTGVDRTEQATINYDQNPPFDLANCPLPKGWPVVVTPESSTPTTPSANIVKPLWLTMSAAEKQEMQEVADRFARAWSAKDAVQLRSIIDINRPLEVTLPSGRIAMRLVTESTPLEYSQLADAKHLTVAKRKDIQRKEVERIEEMQREDVWQHVWTERLAKEPQHRDYHITVVHAYDAANKPLLDREPLTIPLGSTNSALPGVNVLVWVSEKNTEGQETGYAARLFLVKRNGAWKVWQFTREAVNPTPQGWTEDND